MLYIYIKTIKIIPTLFLKKIIIFNVKWRHNKIVSDSILCLQKSLLFIGGMLWKCWSRVEAQSWCLYLWMWAHVIGVTDTPGYEKPALLEKKKKKTSLKMVQLRLHHYTGKWATSGHWITNVMQYLVLLKNTVILNFNNEVIFWYFWLTIFRCASSNCHLALSVVTKAHILSYKVHDIKDEIRRIFTKQSCFSSL